MNPASQALLRALADGGFHSGADLAAAIGFSPATIASRLRELDRFGLRVQAVPGRGYRLTRPLDLMDAAGVREGLGCWSDRLGDLRVVICVDSTSAEARRRFASGAPTPVLCAAEFQSRGRGRRGREWHSALAAGIWMSILIEQRFEPHRLGKVSLVTGVAIARVLRGLGLRDLGIKWPNDLVVEDRKLGGILVEYEAGTEGVGTVTIGIGINTSPAAVPEMVGGWSATDLGTVVGSRPMCRRDVLTGRLAAATLDAIELYAQHGWQSFAYDWIQFDAVAGREVVVVFPNGDRVFGNALGIAPDGALRVAATDGELRCVAGEVSLRLQP